MASLNRATLIGHLGADPEVRRTQDSRPIVNFSLATSESWRDKNTGEKREVTEWHRIVIFNEALCKIAEQFLKKGSPVYLEGQIKTRKWQDRDGQDRYSTEIVLQGFDAKMVLLGGNRGSGYQQGGSGPADYGYDENRAAGSAGGAPATSAAQNIRSDMDDDIPF